MAKTNKLDDILRNISAEDLKNTEPSNTVKSIISHELNLGTDYVLLDFRNYPHILKLLKEVLANSNGFVCGGCFKNILKGDPVKDVDVFFKNEEDFNDAVEYFEASEEWKSVYSNNNATGYQNTATGLILDLVSSIFGTPCEILDKFDFTITKMAFAHIYVEELDDYRYALIAHKDFFEHLFSNRLVLDKDIPFAISTFSRVLRYTEYGYSLCDESKLKLLLAIRKVKDNAVTVNNVFYNKGGWD